MASTASPAVAADDTAPPSAVEDFAYPNAAKVLADKGIKLIKGDGHILLVDCADAAAQIKVMTVEDETVGRAGTYCFKVNAKTGYLALEVPRVFYLKTQDHPITAGLTAGGETQTVDVPQGGFKGVGEGTVGGAQSVLVALHVTG
ncbi:MULTISPECIES: hypothetical protein [Streptomyces]|uniref:hypothetical protein n=1 Tax=Streptomyces TaxID=1883 RepID=UPI0022AF7AC0|nr:hypothetical protein [Streptomyces sp. H39-C1]MCZ4099891.1 hypothetical protein [Streptomyces sp. H39-C1]